MNNEPVAWAYIKDGEFFDAVHPDEHDKYEGMYKTPLYTHPVKEQDESFDRTASHMAGEYVSYKAELTDEKIKQLYENSFDWDGRNLWSFNYIEFARAILKKAQEK